MKHQILLIILLKNFFYNFEEHLEKDRQNWEKEMKVDREKWEKESFNRFSEVSCAIADLNQKMSRIDAKLANLAKIKHLIISISGIFFLFYCFLMIHLKICALRSFGNRKFISELLTIKIHNNY